MTLEGSMDDVGRGKGKKDRILLLAEELAHARLPPPALVKRHSSVPGAAAGEPRALPAEHVDELLLAQAAHLLHVVLVILQAEIDVGLHAAELDRRPIVRPERDEKLMLLAGRTSRAKVRKRKQ
jgi:hypothetical protein